MPLLDTSFLIDFLRGHEGAGRLMRLLEQGSSPLGVSALTHYELYRGIQRSRRPMEEQQAVEDLLRSLAVFPLEAEIARNAGLLQGQMAAEGRAAEPLDLLIGCTALKEGEDLVTRNRRDFEGIPGLRVLSY